MLLKVFDICRKYKIRIEISSVWPDAARIRIFTDDELHLCLERYIDGVGVIELVDFNNFVVNYVMPAMIEEIERRRREIKCV